MKTRKQNITPVTLLMQGLSGTLPSSPSRWSGIGRAALLARQAFALVLMVLIVPMGQGALLFAQTAPAQQQQYNGSEPPPPPPSQNGSQDQYGAQDQGAPPQDQGGPPPDQGAPQGQPLSPEELGQLVAPIALYPDALVAQVLAASTYPTQIVEADRWVQSQGNMPPDQLGAAANAQNWDPSVKALIAFPSVLAQMDKNIQWTTDLGNAYYNQPDDVMAAVQSMRARAQSAGTLHNTPQQVVSDDGGNIVIAPANPQVVYVPVYNPWGVYGGPVVVYPGYYYGPPAGVYFGTGLAIGFGIGIGIGIGHTGAGAGTAGTLTGITARFTMAAIATTPAASRCTTGASTARAVPMVIRAAEDRITTTMPTITTAETTTMATSNITATSNTTATTSSTMATSNPMATISSTMALSNPMAISRAITTRDRSRIRTSPAIRETRAVTRRDPVSIRVEVIRVADTRAADIRAAAMKVAVDMANIAKRGRGKSA